MEYEQIMNMPAGEQLDQRLRSFCWPEAGWFPIGWAPSTDIGAAFQALNELHPVDFTLHHHIFGDGLWYATLYNGVRQLSASAESAPLAICRVILLIQETS